MVYNSKGQRLKWHQTPITRGGACAPPPFNEGTGNVDVPPNASGFALGTSADNLFVKTC